MAAPIVKPELPYCGEIPGGLQPGKMCRIQGVTHLRGHRFDINLQTGPNISPREETALHISVRLYQGYIARNSFQNGIWEDEEGKGSLPFGTGQTFEILILVEPSVYKIAINGKHFCDFAHRIPYMDQTHLSIVRDVSVTLISWEASVPILAEILTLTQRAHEQQPQEGFGLPATGFTPPPAYTPVGLYSPPRTIYGPSSLPSSGPQIDLKTFLELAQAELIDAIKRGAAERMLDELLSSYEEQKIDLHGSNYALHNARYGVYSPLETIYQSGRGSQQPQEHLEGLLALRSAQQIGLKKMESLLSTYYNQPSGNPPQYYGNSNPPQNYNLSQPFCATREQNPLNKNMDNLRNVLADIIATKKQQSPSQLSSQQYGLYPDVQSQNSGPSMGSHQPTPGYLAVNGQQFCEFLHKTPYNDVTNLLGNVPMILISWNASTPALAEALFGHQAGLIGSQATKQQAEFQQGLKTPSVNQQDINMDCLKDILSSLFADKNQTTERQ